MSWWKRVCLGAAAVGLIGAVSGCNGGAVIEEESAGVHPTMVGLPDWVLRGGAAFPEDKGKAIYGVGSVSGVSNTSLAQKVVGDQARVAVANTLKTFVGSVTKVYMKSAIAGEMGDEEAGQLIESVSKAITKTTLVGCEVINRYYDDKNDTWYALAKLEMDNVAMELRKEIGKVEQTRKLKIEAAKAHEELDKIIADTATEMY